MNLSQLEFGALLTYTPRGNTPKALHSKDVMIALKSDQFVNTPPILMSEWIAKRVQQKMAELPFGIVFSAKHNFSSCPKEFFDAAKYIMGSRKNCKCTGCSGSRKTGCFLPY